MTGALSDDLLPAPPPNEIYRMAEYKRELVRRHGPADGFVRFMAAVAGGSTMRLRELPIAAACDVARSAPHVYMECDPGGYPFESAPPRVIGANDSTTLRGIARAAYVACFANAVVGSRSSAVICDDRVLLDFERDERTRSADRPELDAAIFAVDGDRAFVLENVDAPAFTFDEAFVSLLSPHSDAFGHWIWHQVPRLIAALASGALPPMTVLIDENMPRSHRAALDLALGEKPYPVAMLPAGTRARVARAWYAPTPFYVPYLPVNDERWRWDFLATPSARYAPILASMSDSGAALAAAALVGERVFFARRPHLRRRMVDADVIENIARDRGFAIVYPEEMPFEQQLRVLRGARYLVGPEGSAMFLNFYARRGLRLAILSHPITSLLTNYTAPIATLDVDVTVLTGPIRDPHFSGGYPNFGYRHFADYEIEPSAFAAFLDAWTR